MSEQIVSDSLRLALLLSLSQSQCVRLGKKVAHEFTMIGNGVAFQMNGCLALAEANKVGRDDSALVHELEKRVLAVQ